jgi:hypothetical protein
VSSKYRRIAATADPELKAGRSRRRAAEALLDAMGGDQFDLNLAAIDRLNDSVSPKVSSETTRPAERRVESGDAGNHPAHD